MSQSVISEPTNIGFMTTHPETIHIRIEWHGKYQDIWVAPIHIKGNQVKETLRLLKQSLKELSDDN